MTSVRVVPVSQLTPSEYAACASLTFRTKSTMFGRLQNARAFGTGEASLVMHNGRLVAWALWVPDLSGRKHATRKSYAGMIDTYCRVSERRRGYGTLALKALRPRHRNALVFTWRWVGVRREW